MSVDTNPPFGRDENYKISAKRVTDTLWEASKGDLSSIPDSYLKGLEFSYSDGKVSLLELLNKVSLAKTTYEEFSEVVQSLIHTDPGSWPREDSILEIQSDKLLSTLEDEFEDFSEFDFVQPKDMSEKMELFLKKVISSVYKDGVSAVTDPEGNPPNRGNRYLQGEDGESFSGVFYDKGGEEEKRFNFTISMLADGNWQIVY